MPVSAEWNDNTQTIMRWTFTGKWTWDEYYLCRKSINDDICGVGHVVDLIVDMREGSMLPANAMTHARSAVDSAPDNIGVTVVVGTNAMLRIFYNMFSKLYNTIAAKDTNIRVVATLDDAFDLIGDLRNTRETQP